MKKKEATTAKNLYESSLIKKAKDYFLNGSVLTDRKSLHKKIGNYYPSNQESTKAKNISMKFCEKTLLGEIHHLILTGGVGVGKSHLA
ncbi:ATP-binding protein, partial [Enterococcus faecalis]